jgi:hypothetical protein
MTTLSLDHFGKRFSSAATKKEQESRANDAALMYCPKDGAVLFD